MIWFMAEGRTALLSSCNVMKNWLRDFLFRLSNKGEDKWMIILDESVIRVTKNSREIDSLDLSKVYKIVGFKKDLITIDLLCVSFEYDADKHFTINEDMENFIDVIGRVDKLLGGFKNSWREELLKDTFIENSICLWEKKDKGVGVN